jgi:hypothetical protein
MPEGLYKMLRGNEGHMIVKANVIDVLDSKTKRSTS